MNDKAPTVIKRYQNRKLYDTSNSCYVTLDNIAEMVKRGEDVQIIDNKTKEDLTSVTLTQILFEEEKKKKSLLPLHALKNIIQDGGQSIWQFVQKTLDQGVDSISSTKEAAERLVNKIKDEIVPDEDGNILQGVLSKTQDLSKKLDAKVKSTIESVTHVTSLQREIAELRKKIAMLEKKLKEYE